MPRTPAQHKINSAIFFGVALTFFQIALFLWLSPAGDLGGKLASFHHWDGDWFRSILEKGYSFVAGEGIQNNTAFLPGYPMLAGIWHFLGFNPYISLWATSIAASIVFWATAFSISREWTIGSRLLGLAAIASFPTAFFLVAAYSEGVFLALLFFWGDRVFRVRTSESTAPERGSAFVAACTGFAMGLTRIVALCLSVVPLLHHGLLRLRGVRPALSWRATVLATLAVGAGLGAYLVYGGVRFGDYLVPFTSTRQGWWAKPDLGVWTSSLLWLPTLDLAWWKPEVEHFDTYGFDRFATSLVFYALLAVTLFRARVFWTRTAIYASSIGYLLCAWALFALAAMSNHLAGFLSMPRYLFPVFVCLVFAAAEPARAQTGARTEASGPRIARLAFAFAMTALIVTGFRLQLVLIERFAARMWVAGL